MDLERLGRGAPALSANTTLDLVAQARAEQIASAESLTEEADGEISRRAAAAGYEHDFIAEIVLTGGGPTTARLDSWRGSADETFTEAVRKEYRDLGVGFAEQEDRIVCVLIVGLSARDGFARRTAGLGDLQKVRERMLARVNTERKTLRLPPLRESALLDQAAQGHADDMIRRSYYGHESLEDATAADRARRIGYRPAAIGENIAQGQSAVDDVMDAWMASPVHREHLTSLIFKEIGVGMAFGKNNRGYEVVWVQDFGTARPGEPVRPRRPGA